MAPGLRCRVPAWCRGRAEQACHICVLVLKHSRALAKLSEETGEVHFTVRLIIHTGSSAEVTTITSFVPALPLSCTHDTKCLSLQPILGTEMPGKESDVLKSSDSFLFVVSIFQDSSERDDNLSSRKHKGPTCAATQRILPVGRLLHCREDYLRSRCFRGAVVHDCYDCCYFFCIFLFVLEFQAC